MTESGNKVPKSNRHNGNSPNRTDKLSQPDSSTRAIELVKNQPPARTDLLIGAEEVRRRGRRVPPPTSLDTLITTPRKGLLSISISTSPDKPPLKIRLGWINGLFMLVLGLSVLGLAGFALINIVSNSISASGDNLAWQNSASVREQQRQRVIDLQERRLNDLIEENKKRLLEIGELEGQIQEINTNISSLRELARQLQELLNGAVVGSSSSGQIPLVPNPTVKGQGTDSSKYIPPIRLPGGYIEPAQGQQYLNQFTSLLNRLDGVSQLLNNRKQNLTDNTLQLGNYQQEIMQQRAQLDAASANLSQLSRLGDGDAAPDVMPWPGQISSTYGWRMSPFRAGVREYHYGLDIEASEGTPVQVTKAGIVTYFGYDPGYGNMIEVTHAGGWLTRYAHNSKIVAKLGQTVRKGDIIALSGNTGASTGPHIHYEIHRNGVPVNPANFIPSLKGRY